LQDTDIIELDVLLVLNVRLSSAVHELFQKQLVEEVCLCLWKQQHCIGGSCSRW